MLITRSGIWRFRDREAATAEQLNRGRARAGTQGGTEPESREDRRGCVCLSSTASGSLQESQENRVIWGIPETW